MVKCVMFLIAAAVSLGVSAGNVRAEEKKNTCLKCHQKKLMEFKVKHEPAVKDCLQCHEQHGKVTGQPKRLLKPLSAICKDCHQEDIFSGKPGHPVKNHPTWLREFPGHPGQEFTCVSCHNPHAAPSRKLIRFDLSDSKYQGNLCKVCHEYKTRKQ